VGARRVRHHADAAPGDRGLGAAAVVIDSAPTEGVRVNPLSRVRSLFPALKNPGNRHRAVGFTPAELHYAFTNTVTKEESQKVYDRSRRQASKCGPTDYHEFDGRSHWTCGEAGWEEVADYALDWALRNAR